MVARSLVGLVVAGVALGLVALAATGCGGPTIVVTKTVTASPTVSAQPPATPTPSPSPTFQLTLGEQRVYDFIRVNYPKLHAVEREVDDTVKDIVRGTSLDAAYKTVQYSKAFDRIFAKFARLPVGGGAVDAVEQDFTAYLGGLRRYGRNVAKVVWAQGGNYGDYLNGKERAQRYGERVRTGLDDISRQLQGIDDPGGSSSTAY